MISVLIVRRDRERCCYERDDELERHIDARGLDPCRMEDHAARIKSKIRSAFHAEVVRAILDGGCTTKRESAHRLGVRSRLFASGSSSPGKGTARCEQLPRARREQVVWRQLLDNKDSNVVSFNHALTPTAWAHSETRDHSKRW